MEDIKYYEAHVTLQSSALVDEVAIKCAKDLGFRHSIIDGDGDANALIFTSREKDFTTLKDRMMDLVSKINWSRYKIEAIIIDSKIEDRWKLVK